MKRVIVMVLSVGLSVGSVASAEAPKKPARVERTVTGNYGSYPAPVTGCNEPLGTFACLVVATRRTESFFTAKVTDAHGQPVYVYVSATGGRTVAEFCGETTEPIRVAPGSELRFHLGLTDWPLNESTSCLANRVKTTGMISVTLSNQR